MKGFGRMQEVGSGSGRGKGRGDLSPDQSCFSYPAYDQIASHGGDLVCCKDEFLVHHVSQLHQNADAMLNDGNPTRQLLLAILGLP